MSRPHEAAPPSLASLVESFFRRRLAEHRGVSAMTVAAYRDALRLLFVYAANRAGKRPAELRTTDIDQEVVLAFLDHLEKTRGNTPRTRNARLAAIRSFFHHVSAADPGSQGIAGRVLAIPGKRTGRRLLGFLDSTEFDAVVSAPHQDSRQGRRDHALLLFLGRTGARVSEAIAVNVGDLQLHQPAQVLLRGKGQTERAVPLARDVVTVLKELIRERGIDSRPSQPVFVNARGNRLTRFGVRHVVRRVVGSADAVRTWPGRSISPHTFRHSTAMHLLQSGVDLTVIQAWLGHESLNTTHQYVEADTEMKRKAMAECGDLDPGSPQSDLPDALLALLEKLD
jgi:site-specific recombinase XerD